MCVMPVFLVCSSGMCTSNACWCWRLGYWDELGEGRFEESLCDPLGMESDRKVRPQQVFCYRDRDETGGGSGLDSQEQ